ncbi:MAG: TAXI family TRAP transporter solute-binding subunit [Paracoccaceae bacterium]|nr:TAXI family TRAP transporter solute-binding subunit [Paracoccaceae bacterium]
MIDVARNFGRAAVLGLAASLSLAGPASAQSSAVRDANAGRIGIMADTSVSSKVRMGDEIARNLDDRSNLRIVQYLTKGSTQNLHDLLRFRFADLAMMNSDVLIAEKARNPNDARLDDIKYIARMFTSELHLIVREDAPYNSIYDLSGRTVSIGVDGSGTALTSTLVMRTLGISPRAVKLSMLDAMEALKRGELDAVFLLYGKPNDHLRSIDPATGLRLLEVPLTEELAEIYEPAEFTGEDYPGLVSDKLTNSIAVDVVLAFEEGPNIGRDDRRRLADFIRELDAHLEVLRHEPGHHEKWHQFSFDFDVPRWEKADIVAEVLAGTAPAEPENSASIFDVMRTLDDQ